MFLCFSIFKKNKRIDVSPSTPTPIITNMWEDLKPIDLTKIRPYPFPENKYFHEEYQKTQIILHHTVSGDDIEGDISTWANGKYNVGVAIVIDRTGVPWQLFSSRDWAYHLGTGDHDLDKHSIAIEIDNWGGLILGDETNKQFGKNEDGTPRIIYTIRGKYYAYYGNAVNLPLSQIQEYTEGYRGYNYFEKYTFEQIKTVGELLLFWKNKYTIPLYYNSSMFDISQEALRGKPGVWTHTSYRQDKSDIHPQPEMIEMLKTILTDEMPVSFKLKRKKLIILGRKKGLDAENL